MIIKCTECQNEISDKADFCPHCGYKYHDQLTARKVSLTPIIILMIIGLLIMIGTIIFGVLKKTGKLEKNLELLESIIDSDEILVQVGKKSNLFPYDVDKLSFRSGDESVCICSKVVPSDDGFYEISFTAPMLSNSTADGTYAVTVSYEVKVGDVITMVNTDRYIPTPIEIEITHLAPNKFWYKSK